MTTEIVAPAPWGAVRGVLPSELRAIGVAGLLVGTVELGLRPGLETVAALGGVRRLAGGLPVFGDSGMGALVGEGGMPPARLLKVGDAVRFRNPINGGLGELTPEASLAAQRQLGVTVAIAPTLPERLVVNDCERTTPVELAEEWLRRGAATRGAGRVLALIPAGSAAFQQRLLEVAATTGYDGVATAALQAGAGWPDGWTWLALGVTSPVAVRTAIGLGYRFVIPTFPVAWARRGQALVGTDGFDVAAYPEEVRPLDPTCDCPACGLSLGYLAHLIRAKEMVGETLLLLHTFRALTRLGGVA